MYIFINETCLNSSLKFNMAQNHHQLSLFPKKSLKISKGNQKPQIEEELTTQWSKEEELTTQWSKEKKTNNDLQNTTQKRKD